jgi:hypothetical protein
MLRWLCGVVFRGAANHSHIIGASRHPSSQKDAAFLRKKMRVDMRVDNMSCKEGVGLVDARRGSTEVKGGAYPPKMTMQKKATTRRICEWAAAKQIIRGWTPKRFQRLKCT